MIKICRAFEKLRHMERDHPHLLLDFVAFAHNPRSFGDHTTISLKKNPTHRGKQSQKNPREAESELWCTMLGPWPTFESFVFWEKKSLYCLFQFGLELLLLAAKGILTDTICFVSGRGFGARGWWEKKQLVLLNVRQIRHTKLSPGAGFFAGAQAKRLC